MSAAERPRRCEDYDTERGVSYHAHDLPRCRNDAVCGWGSPPRWICQRHLSERLAEIRAMTDRAREAR